MWTFIILGGLIHYTDQKTSGFFDIMTNHDDIDHDKSWTCNFFQFFLLLPKWRRKTLPSDKKPLQCWLVQGSLTKNTVKTIFDSWIFNQSLDFIKIKPLSQFYDHSVEKDWLQHLSWSFQLLEYQMCWKGGGFIWYELTSPLAHMFFAVVTAMVMMISWNYDSAG